MKSRAVYIKIIVQDAKLENGKSTILVQSRRGSRILSSIVLSSRNGGTGRVDESAKGARIPR